MAKEVTRKSKQSQEGNAKIIPEFESASLHYRVVTPLQPTISKQLFLSSLSHLSNTVLTRI